MIYASNTKVFKHVEHRFIYIRICIGLLSAAVMNSIASQGDYEMESKALVQFYFELGHKDKKDRIKHACMETGRLQV